MTENYFGITDTGKVRDNNEDAFIAEPSADSKYILACAIDGVGGYSGGEVAAAIAKKTILECFKRPPAQVIPMLKDCLILANEHIITEKQEAKNHENMACVLTLALVDVEHNKLYYAHVGDTRLYLFRDNSLVKITNDQSFVGFLEDSGRLTEEGAMRHPKRNEIYKALGFGGKIAQEDDYIEIGESPFLPGDTILLCSDGLSDMINRQEISHVLETADSLEDKAKQLVAAANKNGGRDNITVVLVHNNKKETSRDVAEQPAPQKKNESEKEKITAPPPENAEGKPIESIAKPVNAKGNKGLIILLFILLLAFMGACAYLVLAGYNGTHKEQPAVVAAPVKSQKNLQEIKLQAAIDDVKGNTLVLADSAFKSPVMISEAIQINRDTLYIKSSGNITLKSDTGLNRAAFIISSRSKFIVLEGLAFDGFDVAIAAPINTLQLSNTKFNNCKVAVQTNIVFPAKKIVSGKFTGPLLKIDSLPVTVTPKK